MIWTVGLQIIPGSGHLADESRRKFSAESPESDYQCKTICDRLIASERCYDSDES